MARITPGRDAARHDSRLLLCAILIALPGAMGGCTVDFLTGEARPLGIDGPGDASGDATPIVEEVTVRFRNLTAAVVNVQFYATNEPLLQLPDDLFGDDANIVTVGIGLGGSGDLGPFVQDEIQFICTEDLVLGTAGGGFRDNETGEAYGVGTARLAEQGPQFSCGAVIIFEYQQIGEEFLTSLKLD